MNKLSNESISLCQPDKTKSCGACCGLYNYLWGDRKSLKEKLLIRTELYRSLKGDEEGSVENYSRIIKAKEPREKLYEVIYNCEFLGFVDDENKKVGCLLHPALNRGKDLRYHSFYGQTLCRDHFCPSYQHLTGQEKELVVLIIDDWYLYGQIITDIDIVKSFFKEVSDMAGETVSPDLVRFSPKLKDIGFRFFSLKVRWPFKDDRKRRFGKYFFEGWEYRLDKIDYQSIGSQPSRYHQIFLSLSSSFRNPWELREAERQVEKFINDFSREYIKLTGKR